MARDRPLLFALNGGRVSPLAMARVDLQRMKLTAETFHNCFPRVIGPLTFRPGMGYEDEIPSDAVARNIPFIFAVGDTAMVEVTDGLMRVVVDGEYVTRAHVTTAITNGDFSAGASWTLVNADIDTTIADKLVMQASVRGTTASAVQSVSVALAYRTVEHAIEIKVDHGKARFKIGSSSGAQDIIRETELGPGYHSLAFTPNTATLHISFSTQLETRVVVDSVQIAALGKMEIAAPWAEDDLFGLRYEQSGDVIFITHDAYQPRRIERRGIRSWSIVEYQFRNGPFEGRTADVTLTPSVRLGNGTMTSDLPFFNSDHVGTLFQLTHTRSTCDVSLGGNDVYTDWVRVSGELDGTIRTVDYEVSGTWVGAFTVQHADSQDGPWQARFEPNAVNEVFSYDAGESNQITYVRIGFQAGDYTSGTASVALSMRGGGGTGVVRVTEYVSATQVKIEVLERLHDTGATTDWQEGKYSDRLGWPASVALFEGRLWFGGSDQLAGSVSDDFTNFDVDFEGDAGPIIRSIATGPVNKVQWLLGVSRLAIGTSGAEPVARSSSFDEPMSPTNFSIKEASTYGSDDIQAVKLDKSGIFVHRSGVRAYKLAYSIDAQDYTSQEITRYDPTILIAGVKILAVQRQPDTRVWFILEDGTAAVLQIDAVEDVLAWCTFDTEGTIEDVCVLPNVDGDDVHFIVARTIDGVTKRYREKLAYDEQAQGGTENRMADSYVVETATDGVVTGLDHLEACTVVVWKGDSPILSSSGEPWTATVTGGSIILPVASNGTVVVGLAYEGRWKSTKLAYAAQTGTAITQRKKIHEVAPILYKTHNRAVLFGQTFDRMDPLPRVVQGKDQGFNAFLETYDGDAFTLPGTWTTDSRLCMKFRAPLPATVLGVVFNMESHERS